MPKGGRLMGRCVCGSKRFIAHQVWYVDIIVDENGDFLQELGEDAVYDCGKPYARTCVWNAAGNTMNCRGREGWNA